MKKLFRLIFVVPFLISCTCGDDNINSPVSELENTSAQISPNKNNFNLDEDVTLTVCCETDFDFYKDYTYKFYVSEISSVHEETNSASAVENFLILENKNDEAETNCVFQKFSFIQDSESLSEKEKSFYLKALKSGSYKITVVVSAQSVFSSHDYKYSKSFELNFSE